MRALERLTLLIKESKVGRELPRTHILDLLRATIDVVIQFEVTNHRRTIKVFAFGRLPPGEPRMMDSSFHLVS